MLMIGNGRLVTRDAEQPFFENGAVVIDGTTVKKVGDLETEMIREFFYAVSYGAMMNLHLKILDAGNNHHMAEALFKSFGKALDMATGMEPRIKEAWTTKGKL